MDYSTCTNCGQDIEQDYDSFGWVDQEGSLLCDARFQPDFRTAGYAIEHFTEED